MDILKRERATIQAIVEEVDDRIQYAATQECVDVNISIPPQTVHVHWDINRIILGIYNIVINAIEHSRSPSVDIHCRVDGESACFEIVDQGIGIPQEDYDRIFEKFWKKDEHSPKGAGLGLTFAKAIVEAHHGNIELESELGKGTTFYITLPTHLGEGNNG